MRQSGASSTRVAAIWLLLLFGPYSFPAGGDEPPQQVQLLRESLAPGRSEPTSPTLPSQGGETIGRLTRAISRFLRRARGQRSASADGKEHDPRCLDEGVYRTAFQIDQDANRQETDLTVPRAERGGTGTEPTVVEKKEKEVAPSGAAAAPTPLYLNRALGLEDAPFRTYGWIENTFTGNANGTPGDRSNFSVFPNSLANQWQGNQYYFVVENPLEPDDMANLGFRVDTLFGNDWQFTKSYGLFDRAFPNNHGDI
jgi:hypothetical protein